MIEALARLVEVYDATVEGSAEQTAQHRERHEPHDENVERPTRGARALLKLEEKLLGVVLGRRSGHTLRLAVVAVFEVGVRHLHEAKQVKRVNEERA